MMTMDQWIFVAGMTVVCILGIVAIDKFIYLFFRNRGSGD